MIDAVSLAYAAGIVDGEGTIGITELSPRKDRRSPQFRAYVAVVMTDPAVPLWMAQTFPGTVHAYAGRQPGHKGTFGWRLANRRAAEFCGLLVPYLKVKRAQAELLVHFYDEFVFRRRRGLPDGEVERRRRFVVQVRALNKRGA